MDRITIENAAKCLKDAQAEIAREFELDEKTNTFGKALPAWAAAVRDSLHHASEHLTNVLNPA